MTQPTPEQKNELEFRIHIEPVVRAMLDGVEKDSEQMGLTPDLFQRAVWTWAMQRLLRSNKEPAWFIPELERLQGEAG
jgi:hypothetical protein